MDGGLYVRGIDGHDGREWTVLIDVAVDATLTEMDGAELRAAQSHA